MAGCGLQVNKAIKNFPYTVLVSEQLSQLKLFRSREPTPGSTEDIVIASNAIAELTVGVSAGELVLERVPQSALRLRVSHNQASTGFGGRSFTVFEFRTVSERQRFAAVMSRLAIVPLTMPRHLLSTPVVMTPLMQTVLRPVSLWGGDWPHVPVNIFTGTHVLVWMLQVSTH